MERAGWLCERCRKEGLTVPARIVHHKHHLRGGGLKLSQSNLEALCAKCHNNEHDNVRPPDKKQWDDLLGWRV